MPKTRLLWEHNPKGTSPVKSFHEGKIVFPSDVGQGAPGPGCSTRSVPTRQGEVEDVVLFLNHKGTAYIAYPATDGSRLELPGAESPIDVQWATNSEKPTDVICNLTIGESYYRIFPGAKEQWLETSPFKDRASVFTSVPSPGETTTCLIHWRTSSVGSIQGVAYPMLEDKDLELVREGSGRLFGIGGIADLVLYKEGSHTVTAKLGENGEIIVTLTPIATPDES